jgi:hypothetical protein
MTQGTYRKVVRGRFVISVILFGDMPSVPATEWEATLSIAFFAVDRAATFVPRLAGRPNSPFQMWVGDYTHG